MPSRLSSLLACCVVLWQSPVLAEPGPPQGTSASYALFVGSNPGGAQQTRLHFAEDDARTMASIATQLGGYDAARVRILLTPTRSSLLAALDDIEAVMDRHAQREEPSRLLFYYSGHARSDALMLGKEELSLASLRERLQALPANLTLVILDACQSGAFSRVKGAEPAADFSFNSVQRLGVEGIAVMASSSGTELSQESEALRGSFFTHHLAVGLRGAADTNQDGKVSLDEAYSYAYEHTLASTSATSVGGQHPTFESNLRGKGDVPLSYLAAANARVILSGELQGKVVLQNIQTGGVAAEVTKQAGQSMELALPPGEYDAIVKEANAIHRCPVILGENVTQGLDVGGCSEVTQDIIATKGAVPLGDPSRFGAEIAVGPAILWSSNPYGMNTSRGGLRQNLTGTYRLMDNLSVGGAFVFTGGPLGNLYSLGGQLRAHGSWRDDSVTLFVQGGAAIMTGFVYDHLNPDGTYGGVSPTVAADLHGGVYIMPWRHLGFLAQVGGTMLGSALGLQADATLGVRAQF